MRIPSIRCARVLFLGLSLMLTVPTVLAVERGKLHVWINNDKGFNGLADVGRRFEADTGVPVVVETPTDLTRKFDHAGYTREAPDIIIWPHDRFGSWINEGLLETVEPSPGVRQALAPFSWDAVTVGDSVYGYPIATEVVSLIYNRELVSQPPRTLEQVAELDARLRAHGKRAIAWDYRNLYFSWPVIAGAGGFSFGKTDGHYDLTQVGVDTPGAVAAVEAMRELLRRGVIEESDDYGRMMDGFKAGTTAMIINGPWAWSELREAGIDIGIADVPGIDAAHPGKPFVGVLAAGISAASPNTRHAQRFIEDYLLTRDGLNAVNDDKPLGAVTHLALEQTLADDPFIRHTFASASTGEMMPNVPEMTRFWDLLTRRFADMLAGEKPIRPTLEHAGKLLRRLDSMRGWNRRHYLVQ
ncbi:maltose/maltodextrin ABC transporter substrate-binding protein MalE [Marinobacter sp. JSM 1782161]|uniref:maltose/maltodextrin ABC transporter substrate-binding protein MalE n=1 Tax=Marinobacter sp. JSM 1782161 TaxID=2685906 RepID=UPI001D18642C|nr:maltose/maltodextrin ABC transporter substrate-binding protein MalE [Marinobacter sp. JSM 1782161]